jgi:hypothetical protein
MPFLDNVWKCFANTPRQCGAGETDIPPISLWKILESKTWSEGKLLDIRKL